MADAGKQTANESKRSLCASEMAIAL